MISIHNNLIFKINLSSKGSKGAGCQNLITLFRFKGFLIVLNKFIVLLLKTFDLVVFLLAEYVFAGAINIPL